LEYGGPFYRKIHLLLIIFCYTNANISDQDNFYENTIIAKNFIGSIHRFRFNTGNLEAAWQRSGTRTCHIRQRDG
jgi:hypothetical protein